MRRPKTRDSARSPTGFDLPERLSRILAWPNRQASIMARGLKGSLRVFRKRSGDLGSHGLMPGHPWLRHQPAFAGRMEPSIHSTNSVTGLDLPA